MDALNELIDEHDKFVATLPHYYRANPGERAIHHKSEKYFQYIPLTTYAFVHALVPLLKGKRSFLDVGCGMGDKLKLVKQIYPNIRVGGIEFHKPYVLKARPLAPTAEVFHCDAFSYADYHKWNLIYAYRPISNFKLMGKLEEVIMRQMKRGATFVIFGPSRDSAWTSKRLQEYKFKNDPHYYTGAWFWKKP